MANERPGARITQAQWNDLLQRITQIESRFGGGAQRLLPLAKLAPGLAGRLQAR